MVVASPKLGRKYLTNRVLNPGPVVCESITPSARPQSLPTDRNTPDDVINTYIYMHTYRIKQLGFLSAYLTHTKVQIMHTRTHIHDHEDERSKWMVVVYLDDRDV